MLAQIATTLTYLHEHSTYHLDIKAPNIVVKGVSADMLKPLDCMGSINITSRNGLSGGMLDVLPFTTGRQEPSTRDSNEGGGVETNWYDEILFLWLCAHC